MAILPSRLAAALHQADFDLLSPAHGFTMTLGEVSIQLRLARRSFHPRPARMNSHAGGDGGASAQERYAAPGVVNGNASARASRWDVQLCKRIDQPSTRGRPLTPRGEPRSRSARRSRAGGTGPPAHGAGSLCRPVQSVWKAARSSATPPPAEIGGATVFRLSGRGWFQSIRGWSRKRHGRTTRSSGKSRRLTTW